MTKISYRNQLDDGAKLQIRCCFGRCRAMEVLRLEGGVIAELQTRIAGVGDSGGVGGDDRGADNGGAEEKGGSRDERLKSDNKKTV
ncbi:hypothetical protein L1887_15902 [Cichorium endivia]|nr:hypothetical protein L1887_15902 [Cichorium endivia]